MSDSSSATDSGSLSSQEEALRAKNKEPDVLHSTIVPGAAVASGEDVLPQILATSPDCIKILDVDANLLWLNENGRKLLEIDDLESRLNSCWTDWWTGADREKVAEAVAIAAAGGTARFEAFAPTAAGTPKWWDVVVSPIARADGRTDRLLSVSRDVTEQKELFLRLRQSEERQQLIVDNVRDFAIFAIDLEGMVSTWNAGAENLFGYAEQEILGKDAGILFTPEDRAAGAPEAEMQAALTEGYGNDERWHLRRDGTRFRASGTLSPMLDVAGEIHGFTKVCRDITASWKAEQEIIAAREHAAAAIETERSLLADIFNRSPAFMAVLRGTDYRFELVNERYQQLVGHRPLIDRRVLDALPEVVEQGFLELLDGVYKTGETYVGRDIPILLQREPGQPLEKRFLDFVYQPLFDSDGSVSGILAHGVDLTERKIVEDTLRQSEQSFRQLADALPQIVWKASPDGSIYYYNEQWYQYTAMPEGESVNDNWEPYIHPDDLARITDAWEVSVRNGSPFEEEYRLRRASDGAYRWHLARAVAILDGNGEIARWFGTGTDIHDLRVATEALTASDDRLNAALAAAEMGTFRWEPDSGAFIEFDANLKRLFDVPVDADTTLDDLLLKFHPDDLPEFQERLRRSIEEGDDFEMTYRVVLGNGDVRWLYDRAKMQPAESGRPRHLVGACVDITQRKLAEDAARRNAQRLHAVFSQATAGIAQTDRTGRFIEVNARYCEIVGRSEEDLLGMRMQEITHPDDLKDNLVLFDRLTNDGIPFQITKRYIRPDESIAWVDNYISAITDSSGRPEYVVVVTIDVTERMKVEEQQTRLASEREQLLGSERRARAAAEEASRMKDEFLATISHELRTPLNAIVGWSGLLQAPDTDREMLDEGLVAIQRNAQTQSRLIEDVLDVARITTGKVQLNVAPLRLCDVIEAAVATVRTAALAKQIGIETDCGAPGDILGDAERLQQVFWNLLSNAIKFTGADGKITVRLQSDGTVATVSVTDTGNGIDPAFLPYVFERFRQADARITRREGGLGLGLSIVRNLVEMHRGSVRAESDGPGTGSTFIVTLPMGGAKSPEEINASVERGGSIETEAGAILKGKRAIVLDDDPDARRILEATLVRCGMLVTALPSVAAAIDLLRRDHDFDVAISDIGMPDEDGFQFIRRLRELEQERGLARLPAAALTAYTRDQDRTRATDEGFDRFIAKPVHPHEVLATVMAMVEGG